MSIESNWKMPITIPEGVFYKIAGWVSEHQILYISKNAQTYKLYRYDFLTGKSKLIFNSVQPIVNVQISPSRKYILIHSAPSPYVGVITIINQRGAIQIKQSVTSHDLSFEWNPYNESEILVEKFNEDWEFQVFLLDLKHSKLTKLSVKQPFNKWFNKKEIIYLDWDQNHQALSAPLVTGSLNGGHEKTLFNGVVNMAAFRNLLMTITVNKQDAQKAEYSFYNQKLKRIAAFSIPQLTKYSGWLTPFFDYSSYHGKLVSFQPVMSGEADNYNRGFELVIYNIDKGSRGSIIFDSLENAPVEFSPFGEELLYGNRFEKVIDLKTKKIYKLIKE